MCRNIKVLFNFEPPATDKEIYDSSLQFVRKVSGFHTPSKVNEEVFNEAVDEIAKITKKLLHSLVTAAKPRNRQVEAMKARERAIKRFGLPKNR